MPEHNSTTRRRSIQFSLRKLMLWTVILATCLSTHRWVLTWLSGLQLDLRMPDPRVVAVCFTIYLAVLIPIRVIWGTERGWPITILGTWLVLTLPVEVDLVAKGYGMIDALAVPLVIFIAVFFLSAPCFLFVHILVVAVDRIDTLLQRRPPQEK